MPVISALKALWLLGALDNEKSLTDLGRAIALFPLEPCYARAILAAKDYGCVSEILDIVSVLSASSKLFFDTAEQRDTATEARRRFRHSSGDHLTILNAMRSYRESIQDQTKRSVDWCRAHFLNERTFHEASQICHQLRAICDRLQIDWKTSCGDKEDVLLRSLAHGLIQNTALLQSDGSYKQIMGPTVCCQRREPS
jgi:ATP-dependent RNA helicase DHX33